MLDLAPYSTQILGIVVASFRLWWRLRKRRAETDLKRDAVSMLGDILFF
jgi:hypothetical protein